METELIFGADASDTLFGAAVEDSTQVAALDAAAAPFQDAVPIPLDAAQVVIPEGQTVVYMPVVPGETVELPFGSDAQFLVRLGDGNLAIKVGAVTVILEGYAAAVDAAAGPVIVVSADGRPLDIALLLAATDPGLDIQTAAGPGEGAGPDNSGAIFQTFGETGGLGGFESVGGQNDAGGPDGFGNEPGSGLPRPLQAVNGVNAVNAAPVVADVDATTDEDTAFAGKLTGFDAEGDPLTFHTAGAVPAGLVFGPDGTWSFDPAGQYDFLAPGQHATVAFQYQANDGKADSGIGTVTLEIDGVNDPASIGGDKTGTVTEDSGIAATGTLVVTDPDTGESHTRAATKVAATYGTWSVDGDGHWSYTLDDTSSAVNTLGDKDTLTETFTVLSQDGTASQTVTVTIQGANDAPVAADDAYAIDEDGTLIVSSPGFLANDQDAEGDALSIAGVVTAPAHGVVSVRADGSFDYTPELNYSGTDSFSYYVDDGTANSNIATVHITVNPVNDAPVIGGMGGVLNYTENDAPTAIDSAVTVSDVDSANFNGGSLRVSFTANGTSADQLSILNQGTAAGQIGVNGANVTYGGVTIGTWSGGANGGDLVIDFASDSVTPALAQALIQQIAYANSSTNPAAADRTVTFALTDGDGAALGGGDTGTATATVHVNPADHRPIAVDDIVLTNNTATTVIIPEWALLSNDDDRGSGGLDVAGVSSVFGPVFHTPGMGTDGYIVATNPELFLNGSFSYTAESNGGTGAPATVDMKAFWASTEIQGTAAHEIIISDFLETRIDGKGGSDIIFAGPNDDTLIFHDGDTIRGGADTLPTTTFGVFLASERGDVLVLDHNVDFTDPALAGKVSGIETISMLDSDADPSGGQTSSGQTLSLDATAIRSMSDHLALPDSLFPLLPEPAIRIDLDANDHLYLSNSKDGGEWFPIVGVLVSDYDAYVHRTVAANLFSGDAYALVQHGNAGNVVLNQDAPAP